MKGSKTLQRMDLPTAMLLGLSEDHEKACLIVLAEAAMRVIRVGHPAAAAERMPVMMPLVVVICDGLRREDEDVVVDRGVAVGATIVKLDRTLDSDSVERLIRKAVADALTARL